jgi:hypothetical protein
LPAEPGQKDPVALILEKAAETNYTETTLLYRNCLTSVPLVVFDLVSFPTIFMPDALP